MSLTTTSTEIAAADPIIVVDELVIDGQSGDFPLNDIRISKTNRKRFDQDALAKLAENIKRVGVLQAIIIRPVAPTEAEPEQYEIVAGERRYRAAIIAGLTTIPVKVRHLSDRDALEIQILENIQRENPHEMEEAEGFQNLMLNYAYTADQLAEKIGKSRSHVYSRLKLCSLATGCRDQFLERKFSASIALLISRIPVPELQVKAMNEILNPSNGTEPMSYRFAHQHIQRRYMLDLGDATFPIKDAKLLATAGSCITCPKRTGNDPIIFADVDPDICTDPDCFAEKIAANAAKKITWANKNGVEIIEGEEAEDLVNKAEGHGWNSEFVSEETDLALMKRVKAEFDRSEPLRKHLNTKLFPKAAKMARDSEGHVTTLYLRDQMQNCLEKAGICYTEEEQVAKQNASLAEQMAKQNGAKSESKKQAEAAAEAEEKELERKVKAEQQYRIGLYKKLRNRAGQGLNLDSLRILLKHIIEQLEPEILDEHISYELFGLIIEKQADMEAYIDQATTEQAQLLLIDFLLGEALVIPSWCLKDYLDRENDAHFCAIQAMAEAEGIDLTEAQNDTPELTEEEPAKLEVPAAKKRARPSKEYQKLLNEKAEAKAEPWPFPPANQGADNV